MNATPQQLDEEMSFKLYMLNRLVQQTYQTFLSPLNLTYPQYLVMKILAEEDHVPVNVISSRLMLESNTVTPLLQRMQRNGLITRTQKCEDHRQRIISLTAQGKNMQHHICQVSAFVATSLNDMKLNCGMANDLIQLLDAFITRLA